MQVLPTQDARAAFLQNLAASGVSSQQANDLSDLFAKNLAAAMAGNQAGTNGTGLGRPVLDQGSSQPTTNTATGALGVDSSGAYGQFVVSSAELRDTKVGAEEFAALKDGLSQHGFTDDDIGQLENKLSSPNGLTWGELVASVQQVATRQETATKEDNLTADDRRQLLSFFGKVGFTPQQSESLVNDLAGGRTKSVFSQLAGKLATMDKDKTVNFDAGELAALGKGLRLTADGTQKLAALANGLQGKDLSVGNMAQTLGAIGAQVQNDGQTRVAVADSLRSLVSSALNKASEKLSSQKKASAASDSATTAANSVAKQAAATEAKKETDFSDVATKSKVDPTQEQSGKALDSAASKSSKKNSDKNSDGNRFNLPTAKANATETRTSSDRAAVEKAWNDFWGKAADSSHAGSASGSSATSLASSTATKATGTQAFSNPLASLGQQTTSAVLSNANTAADKLSETARLIMPQVEAAILNNTTNGPTRLTLELNPANLGKMSVMLTTKGDEVKAVLRPESPEAAAALREGLQSIRKSLEDQGLKVSKLEVQQGPTEQFNSSNWQGSSQHNQAWQREQRNFTRRLNQGLATTGSGLAQDMQIIPQQARTAASGLDMMA